jgi:nitrate/TMAO reductase-like tetraheme cytochrome c subunit
MKFPRITTFGYGAGLMLGIGLVLIAGAMELSSTPKFCGTCHVMKPYYESWVDSNHAHIPCVDCHIPPGLTAELRKKYEALSMVARYFTGTYSTNPWTEVDDEACLRCHERRLLAGRELFGEVLFDHRPHLAEVRRGMRLRCTSCHSQIVQGSHITVTSSTCVLCHFKDQEPGTGAARCTLCHQVPDNVVDAAGLGFDHSDVTRFGMVCESCHSPASPAEGSVPEQRCFICHNDPERLAEYDDEQLLHQMHVTEHKVDCMHCHQEIEHVTPQHIQVAQTECGTCHAPGHSPQRDLYAGIGGKDVPPMPDFMYRAGVRCEGCHLDLGDARDVRTAGEISCMSCHGPDYRQIYQDWSQTLQRRTAALRRQLEATSKLTGSSPPSAYFDARANLELVERGTGVHNFPFSIALLDAAHGQLNEARQDAGHRTLSLPWPQVPYESACLECHQGIEERTSRALGRRFPHGRHVVAQGIDCEHCHTSHEEREREGVSPLRLGADDCSSCHHGGPDRGTCLDCHGPLLEQTFTTEKGEFDHALHVTEMELDCETCHGEPPGGRLPADREVCATCHE